MTISSRTTEGDPGRCPVCGEAERLEASAPSRDATCPACGSLLWIAADAEPTPHRIDELTGLLEARFGPLTVEQAWLVGELAGRLEFGTLFYRAATAATFQEFLDGLEEEPPP